jgi:hypothetical protein
VTSRQPSAAGGERPEISILIGLASREDDPGTLRLLHALRNQQGGISSEMIVAHRRQDQLPRAIAREYPEVRLLAAPPHTSLPALRTMALAQARADLIAVIADHCLPCPGWLKAFHDAFRNAPANLIAVGGVVVNRDGTSAAQRAAFTFEYAPFIPPLPAADTGTVPGMNICYRRTAFREADQDHLRSAFWENFHHRRLQANGSAFRIVPEARVTYQKEWTSGAFLRQRFNYSRYYAARRLQGQGSIRRGAMGIFSILLPPLLLVRHGRAMAGRDQNQRAGPAALPYLVLYSLAAAAGELAGAFLGDGDILKELS